MLSTIPSSLLPHELHCTKAGVSLTALVYGRGARSTRACRSCCPGCPASAASRAGSPPRRSPSRPHLPPSLGPGCPPPLPTAPAAPWATALATALATAPWCALVPLHVTELLQHLHTVQKVCVSTVSLTIPGLRPPPNCSQQPLQHPWPPWQWPRQRPPGELQASTDDNSPSPPSACCLVGTAVKAMGCSMHALSEAWHEHVVL